MKPILAAVGLALSATLLQVAPGLAASVAEEPSVLVDVSNVAEQLAEHLSVEPERIPPGVEMPIEAAAEVCAATPDMLAYAGSGGQQIGCEASKISDDLIQALKEQLDLRKDSTGSGQGLN
jgi:hypothetical protein